MFFKNIFEYRLMMTAFVLVALQHPCGWLSCLISDRIRIRNCQCGAENDIDTLSDNSSVVSSGNGSASEEATRCTSNVAYITDVSGLGWRLAFQHDNAYSGGFQETRQECWASAYTESAKEIMSIAI